MTRALPRVALALAFAAVMIASPVRAEEAAAHADDNPFDLSPEQLFGATVMSVSKTPERVWDSPAAVFVLTNEDIKRSGATSIPEVLRLVPGVDVARINTSGWAIGIRGFNGALDNKLLVLIDGREVYDHLFSGVYWDVQDTPLEDIDRIEVVRGPGATLWGANAVNGVINIITKDSADTQGGLVAGTAGIQERAIGTARYGGAIGNGTYRVYGKYLNRGEETLLDGSHADDSEDAWRSGFRSDWHFNMGRDKLTMQGDAYKNEESQFRNISNLVAFPYFTREHESITADGANLLARWTRSLSGDSRFQLQSYFDYTYRGQALLADRRLSFDTEAQYDFPTWGRHKLVTGARVRYSHDEITPSALILTSVPEDSEQQYSAFVQDQITLQPDRWMLTLGSKFERNQFTGFEFEPSARLQWHPDDTHDFWASVSRAVRTPSRIEHDLQIFAGVVTPFGPLVPVEVQLQPSPDFDSEVLVAYEAGYRQQINRDTSLDVALFLNDYSRLETLKIGAPDFSLFPPVIILPIGFTNDTAGKTYGIETTLNWRARPDLNFSFSHSLLEMDLHGPPSNVAIGSEFAEKQSPKSELAIKAQWDVTDKVTADTMVFHTSSLPNFKVSQYWRVDERLGWKVNSQLEASLAGQNLLRDRHREFSSASDANAGYIDRAVFGNLTWRF